MDVDMERLSENKQNHSKNYVFFWRTNSPFSNWYPAKYTYNGIEFNCSEQGVMWNKATLFGDDEIAKKILDCSGGEQRKIKELGRQVKNFKESVWVANREHIYKEHCRAKFIQNNDLRQKLLETGNKTLVEASPTDKIWGIGLEEKNAKLITPDRWPGLNLLGKVLTEIKNELIDT
jgi:ribA/ribD-fused uncharacterized protein